MNPTNQTTLTTYPMYFPPLDSPPLPALWQCPCGRRLLERIWHHRTEDVPAHWEICEPPMTPVLGLAHTCEGVSL